MNGTKTVGASLGSKVEEGTDSGKNSEFDDLERIFEYIDKKHGCLINRLRDFVEFQTVSSDPSKLSEINRMADFLEEMLKKFQMKTTVMNMMKNENNGIADGCKRLPLILAETEVDPSKRTVLVYCHYDVYPLGYHDCWADPFELMMSHDESELHGKGVSASKGPMLCVINAIGAYQRRKIPLPVNVKLLLDPMGTAEDDFTGKFLKSCETDFFLNVDFVCLCMGRWLGTTRPCVIHGSRGICYFTVEVEGSPKDLHSGAYGGLFNEPMADLIHVLNGLVDKNGIIRVTDIYKDVPPVSEGGKKFLKTINFNVRDYQQKIGTQELLVNEDKASILTRLWRQPSLSIHGIQGAFSGPGTKNVIPAKVMGKFSINIVPNMSPTKVKKKVIDYLDKVWKTRKSFNKIRVQMTIGKLSWFTDPTDVNVIAAKKAVADVYTSEPDLICESRRVRIANVLRKMTDSPVVMIPIGKSSDISSGDSEKINVINYMNGSKIFVAYFKFLAEMFPKISDSEEVKCTCKISGQLESCKCYLKYVVTADKEMESIVSDWSIRKLLSAGITDEDKPAFKYYDLSLQVVKKLDLLHDVISICEVFPKRLPDKQLKSKEEESNDKNMAGRSRETIDRSRAALASFSITDLQAAYGQNAQLLPGNSAKSFAPDEMAKPENISVGALKNFDKPNEALESSTKTIRPNIAGSGKSKEMVALEPTVFSFTLVQNLERARATDLSPAQRQKVLRRIRSFSPEPVTKKPKGKIAESKSLGKITIAQSNPIKSSSLSKKIIDRSLQSVKMTSSQNIDAESSQKSIEKHHKNPLSAWSSIEHQKDSQKFVRPTHVLSSTSQLLYQRRLLRKTTDSTRSIKSAHPSFRVIDTDPQLASERSGPSLDTLTVSSSNQPTDKPMPTPGGPTKPLEVVGSVHTSTHD